MLPALHGSHTLLLYYLPLGGVALGVVGILAESTRCARWFRAAPLLVPLLFTAAVFGIQPGWEQEFWPAAVILSLACGVSYLLRSPLAARGMRLAWTGLRRPRTHWGLLLAASVLFGGAWLYSEESSPAALGDLFDPLSAQLQNEGLHATDSARAHTDRGRPIPLYLPPAIDLDRANITKFEKPYLEAARERAIRMAPADPSHNCHGWTFAGGDYWVKGEDVEVILQDNGYRPVSSFQVNDVVVFRDGAGDVTHSGVIRSILPNGEFLIESKWGWAGRFVHTRGGPIYGERWTVYRSDRDGHRLRMSGDETHQTPPRAF